MHQYLEYLDSMIEHWKKHSLEAYYDIYRGKRFDHVSTLSYKKKDQIDKASLLL